MTDTTTLDERRRRRGDRRGAPASSSRATSAGRATARPHDERRSRRGCSSRSCCRCSSIAAVAVLVLNISRVFLAGDEDAALVIGIDRHRGDPRRRRHRSPRAPRLRTSSLALILCGLVVVVVSLAGLISLGPSLERARARRPGYEQPTGPASRHGRRCSAEPSIKFNATEFTATGRDRADQLQRRHRPHPRHRRIPKFAGFLLTTDAGGPKSGKVELTPGQVHDLLHRPGPPRRRA